MSDNLDIQQGDSAVATDELLAAVEGLRAGADNLQRADLLLRTAHRMGIDRSCETATFPSFTDALENLRNSIHRLERISEDAGELGTRLRQSSDSYAWCEQAVGGLLHVRAQIQMSALGLIVGRLIPWWVWLLPMPEATDEAKENTRLDGGGELEFLPLFLSLLFSQPGVVDATADYIDGGNDFVLGLVGVPGAGLFFGDEGSGLSNGAMSAATFGILAGRLGGVLNEGPVSTQLVETRTSTSAPSGVAGSFEQLPAPTTGDAVQIKIEAIHYPDKPTSYEVYIAGTQSFDFVSRAEPNDMTSNFWSIAGQESAAYRAVVEAMKQAGITASSEVNFFGHSQGGLIAAQLAASGDYNAKTMMSWGAPNGNIDLPPTVNSIIIKHEEDPIPALGGNAIDRDALTISRTLYDGVLDVPTDRLVPAHHAEPYLETSKLIDSAESPQVLEALKVLADSRRGATSVTSTTYLATRTDAG